MKRICLRMAAGDLLLLRKLSGRRATVAGYLLYLVREMREHKRHRQKKEQHLPYHPFREIREYKEFKPHKVSFRIRVDDLKSLNEFTKRYRRKYSEKLTKSEVICFAHDVFRWMGSVQQERVMEDEKNDHGHDGRTQKIAVSWSDLGHYPTKEKPKRGTVRIALYNLLRNDKFKNLVAEGS